MAGTYSQNDTHDFAKSCVSFSDIGMSIHKSHASADYVADRTVKNVYEKQESGSPYTRGLASSVQQAHSLYKKRLLFCTVSASAVAGPLTQPRRQHLSEELCRRRSMLPTLRQRREIGRKHYRAARPAGRPRELRGERTGMHRGYMENVRMV